MQCEQNGETAIYPYWKDVKRSESRCIRMAEENQKLRSVLNTKDESSLFDIANNFSIRRHSPNQKTNYDQTIWYSWIFHFYLATYHTVIRLLIKKEKESG